MPPPPPAEQQGIATLHAKIMGHIGRNNWFLIDWYGKPTLWARWHPDYVNWFPASIVNRKLNSVEIIASLQFVYKITGNLDENSLCVVFHTGSSGGGSGRYDGLSQREHGVPIQSNRPHRWHCAASALMEQSLRLEFVRTHKQARNHELPLALVPLDRRHSVPRKCHRLLHRANGR